MNTPVSLVTAGCGSWDARWHFIVLYSVVVLQACLHSARVIHAAAHSFLAVLMYCSHVVRHSLTTCCFQNAAIQTIYKAHVASYLTFHRRPSKWGHLHNRSKGLRVNLYRCQKTNSCKMDIFKLLQVAPLVKLTFRTVKLWSAHLHMKCDKCPTVQGAELTL